MDGRERDAARRQLVRLAIAEDFGAGGDVTSNITVPHGSVGTAQIVSRGGGVIAGLEFVIEVYEQMTVDVDVTLNVSDGDAVASHEAIGAVQGDLRAILAGERVALNFLGHLSGVATQTRRFVEAVAGTNVAIRDTRKTTPGLRLFEKGAVLAGGGHNHRFGLDDQILVKDNHMAAAGGVAPATRSAIEGAHGLHVQVEVTGMDELDDALREGATDILLDNFSVEGVRQASRRVDGRAALEASGGITLDNIRTYAEAGVDRISTGALTHSAPWLDIGLDIVI